MAPTPRELSRDDRDPVADLYAELLDERQAGRDPDIAALLERCPADRRDELRRAIDFVDRTGRWPSGPPRRLGDFEIRRELGRGGMGIVYEARQVSLDRRVALKLVAPWLPRDEPAHDRFQREARAIARLRHPGIVTVFEAGEIEGHRYIAMELVEGRGLDQVLAEAKQRGEVVPVRQVLRWGAEIAAALEAAHASGVVHRDVKPSNVHVDVDGRARLLDFGLARFADAARSLSGFRGSPHYASPEQVAARDVGPASDVYSLGMTLYEAVTGRPAFDASSTPSLLHDVLHRDPPSPRLLIPNLSRDVETVLLHCLEKATASRYSGADALREDLEALLEVRPIRARPPSRIDRAAKWVRRNRPLASAILVSGIAGLVVAGSLLERSWSDLRVAESRRLEGEAAARAGDLEGALRAFDRAVARQPDDARLIERRAEIERAKRDAETAALREEKRRVEGLRLIFQARTELPRDPALALDLAIEGAQRHPGAVANDTLRAALAANRQLRSWSFGRALVEAAFDSTGQLLALDEAGSFTLRSRGSGPKKPLADTVAGWAMGGRFCALLTGSDGVVRFDLETGVATASWRVEAAQALAVSRAYAAVVTEDLLQLWSAQGELIAEVETEPVLALGFSDDGERLALGREDGTVSVRSIPGLDLVTSWRHHDQGVREVVSAGKAGWLTRSWDRTVRLVDEGAEPLAILDHGDDVRCAVSAPGGDWIASGCDDGVVRLARSDGTVVLAELGTWIFSLAPSSDGRRLAAGCGDGTVRVWDLERGEPPLELPGSSEVVAVGFQKGELLQSVAVDGTVRLWNVAESTEPIVLRGHEAEVESARFGGDGHRILTHTADGSVRVFDGGSALVLSPTFVADACWSGPDTILLAEGAHVSHWSLAEEPVACWRREVSAKAVHSAPGGALAVAISDSGATLLSVESGEVQARWSYEHGLVGPAAFGGRYVVAVPNWWRPDIPYVSLDDGGEELRLLIGHGERVVDVAAHPARPLVASITWDGTLRMWDLDDARELRRWAVGGRPTSLAWSPDGRQLVVGTSDGRLSVWSGDTDDRAWEISVFDAAVSALQFSPDGRWLAAAGGEAARIHEAASGEEHSSLIGHRAPITSLEFSPDGEKIVTASEDGTARVWIVVPLELATRQSEQSRR